jgi:hypothetical protein
MAEPLAAALRNLIAAFPEMQLLENPRWTEDIAIRRVDKLLLTSL